MKLLKVENSQGILRTMKGDTRHEIRSEFCWCRPLDEYTWREFFFHLFEGRTKKEARKLTGISKVNKGVRGPRMKQLFTEIMDDLGITDKLLAEKILDGLSATRIISATAHQEREEVTDYATRHLYVKTATQLKGHLVENHAVVTETFEERLKRLKGAGA